MKNVYFDCVAGILHITLHYMTHNKNWYEWFEYQNKDNLKASVHYYSIC